MATVKQYIQHLRNRQRIIAAKLGSDIGRADPATRAQNIASLAMLAVVVKTLVDKGVITDAELIATLDNAQADTYVRETGDPPAPLP